MLYSHTIKLVRYYEGADGLKTGHTDNAKYCLAATAKKDGMRLIGIVLGEEDSKTRNNEAMGLLDYGFGTIKMNVLKKSGSLIKNIKIDKASKKNIRLSLKNDLGVIENKSNGKHEYKYNIKFSKVKLPIKKNQVVGKIDVMENNKIVSSGDLISLDNVSSMNYLELFMSCLKNIVSGVI